MRLASGSTWPASAARSHEDRSSASSRGRAETSQNLDWRVRCDASVSKRTTRAFSMRWPHAAACLSRFRVILAPRTRWPSFTRTAVETQPLEPGLGGFSQRPRWSSFSLDFRLEHPLASPNNTAERLGVPLLQLPRGRLVRENISRARRITNHG